MKHGLLVCLLVAAVMVALPPGSPARTKRELFEPLNYHPKQREYACSTLRFNIVPAGRRTAKTEIGKRRLVYRALSQTLWPDPHYFVCAPTRDQVKRIYWDSLKAMIPGPLISGRPRETELMIPLINGAKIYLVGMDKPARIEGYPWNGGIMDEYADMKPDAWEKHVRPACSDRLAWVDFLGVPEGRNHFYTLYTEAHRPDMQGDWATFTWTAGEVLPLYVGRQQGLAMGMKGRPLVQWCKECAQAELDAAMREMDPLTFDQEYNASFVSFEGRAYYCFDMVTHARQSLPYNDEAPLIFCFDFNRAPGVAAVCQEGADTTLVIGEVWIPRNSTTPAVCRKLIADWADHKGHIYCYGDATGGAKGSAKVEGSDWDLIEAELRPAFKERLHFRVPKANPKERARVNAMNSRLKSASGKVSMQFDAGTARHVIRCTDSTVLLKGGSGEIEQKPDSDLTHISGALGYYVVAEFPIGGKHIITSTSMG